ncbi:hypothetical protein PO909_013638 [Leuciscus waleckii]
MEAPRNAHSHHPRVLTGHAPHPNKQHKELMGFGGGRGDATGKEPGDGEGMAEAGRWDRRGADECCQMLPTQSATRAISHGGVVGGRSHDCDFMGIILVTIDGQAAAGRAPRTDVEQRRQ